MSIEEKIRTEPLYILCVENPTNEQIKIALREGGPELLHLFLNDDLYDFFCIENGEEELSLVKNLNGLSDSKLRDIIFKDYTLISKVDNPPEQLQIHAINRNPDAILLINNASYLAWKVALSIKPQLIDFYYDPPEELQMTAIRANVKSIKFLDKPTKKVQTYAIRLGIENIANIKNIHPDVACECIKRYGLDAFMFLRRTDKEVLEVIKNKLKNM